MSEPEGNTNGHSHTDASTGVDRRGAITRMTALSAGAVIAGNVATAAWATNPQDRRLSIYEGKYAIDGHKVVDGYFATPRGRTGMDVLVVIPGAGGIDDATRDLVRRHALAGKIAFAPDLAKTTVARFASRDAMIADFVHNAPRLRRLARGNGTVRVVAA